MWMCNPYLLLVYVHVHVWVCMYTCTCTVGLSSQSLATIGVLTQVNLWEKAELLIIHVGIRELGLVRYICSMLGNAYIQQ